MQTNTKGLLYPIGLLAAYLLACSPPPVWNPSGSSSSSGGHRIQGPGRPGMVAEVVGNATRVRSPALTPKVGAPSQLTQGLNGEDGGRNLTVDFSGTTVNFSELYFTIPPLKRYVNSTDDAGVATTIEEVAFPAVILKILPDGSSETFYTFDTDETEMERFRSGFGGAVMVDGEELYEPRNLVLTTTVDANGDVYLASNGSLEILVFTAQGAMRSIVATLPAPASDLKVHDGYLYASLLPLINDTFTELVAAPVIVRFPVNMSGSLETIATLSNEFERYNQNAKNLEIPDLDGGVHTVYAPTSMVLAIAHDESGTLYVSGGKEGVVYQALPDGGVTPYLQGLVGITSLTTHPLTSCMYATLPSILIDGRTTDAGTPWLYEEVPRIMALCPDAGSSLFLDVPGYNGMDPELSLNGFGSPLGGNRYVGIGAVSTIGTDGENLILADPVRSAITAIQVVE